MPFKSSFLFLVVGVDCEGPVKVVVYSVISILVAGGIPNAAFNIFDLVLYSLNPLLELYHVLNNLK